MIPKTQPQDNTPSTPPIKSTPQHWPQPTIMQQQTNITNDNAPWGNATNLEQPHNYFWVLSKNVGMLNTTSLDMLAIVTGFQEFSTSIFLAQETNTPWNPKNLQHVAQQCNQVYHHKKIATSSSQEKCDGTYQANGTMTLALKMG